MIIQDKNLNRIYIDLNYVYLMREIKSGVVLYLFAEGRKKIKLKISENTINDLFDNFAKEKDDAFGEDDLILDM